jgi:hypothetical protein
MIGKMTLFEYSLALSRNCQCQWQRERIGWVTKRTISPELLQDMVNPLHTTEHNLGSRQQQTQCLYGMAKRMDKPSAHKSSSATLDGFHKIS